MNKLHRLGMIWLKIGQKSQGYTNTGTRRRPGRLGGESEIKRENISDLRHRGRQRLRLETGQG